MLAWEILDRPQLEYTIIGSRNTLAIARTNHDFRRRNPKSDFIQLENTARPKPNTSWSTSWHHDNMSGEKRLAPEFFGSSQLVKRQKSDVNINSDALVKSSGGALIQGVGLIVSTAKRRVE